MRQVFAGKAPAGMLFSLVCCAFVAGISFPAFGQDVPPQSTIETQGVATVDAPPAYVEFWLHASFTGATLVEAVDAAEEFEPRTRDAIKAATLEPTEMTFTGIAIPSIDKKAARISAKLRFRANTYTSAAEGPRLFAALCDKINAIAAGLPSTVEGPVLAAEDKEATENAAIARATERAYAPAKAAAQVMNGQVIAVDKVSVEGVVWNRAPEMNAAQPDLQKLTCTATVRVNYAFSPA